MCILCHPPQRAVSSFLLLKDTGSPHNVLTCDESELSMLTVERVRKVKLVSSKAAVILVQISILNVDLKLWKNLQSDLFILMLTLAKVQSTLFHKTMSFFSHFSHSCISYTRGNYLKHKYLRLKLRSVKILYHYRDMRLKIIIVIWHKRCFFLVLNAK